jgi:hypothetical protein
MKAIKQEIKKTKEGIKIEGGLFFKEDFKKLPDGVVIYIKEGLLMVTR